MSRIKTLIRAVLPVIRTDWSSSLPPPSASLPLSLHLSFSSFIRAPHLLRRLLSPERTRSSPFSCSLADYPVPRVPFLPRHCCLCRPYCSGPRSRARSRFASARANREMVNGRRDEPDSAGGETFARRLYSGQVSRDISTSQDETAFRESSHFLPVSVVRRCEKLSRTRASLTFRDNGESCNGRCVGEQLGKSLWRLTRMHSREAKRKGGEKS